MYSLVWAMAICVAVTTAILLFATYALVFGLALFVVRLVRAALPEAKPESPFVSDKLPPQIITPRESEFI
jgi:hypothetical protein